MNYIEFWLSKHAVDFGVTIAVLILAVVAVGIFAFGSHCLNWVRWKWATRKRRPSAPMGGGPYR